jgi:hypothetical protein
MISVYKIFQIVIGIILSGFIFYLLMSYTGTTAQFGRSAVIQKTLDVFLQDCDSVYNTGNPISFKGFSADDFSSCNPRSTTPPKIYCFIDERSQETEDLLIPVLMKPAQEVGIYRGSIDHSWTRLDYIEAVPAMTIVISPLQEDDTSWHAIEWLVSALPDTTGASPSVRFELCDGPELLLEESMGSAYEKPEFLNMISSYRDALGRCTAGLQDSQMLVTISSGCSPGFSGPGVCINPAAQSAYLEGSQEAYIYKDGADLAALVIGGQSRGPWGQPKGGELWELKNRMMLAQLSAAAEVMESRSGIIIQLPQTSQDCREKQLEFRESLSRVRPLSAGDPYDAAAMSQLSAELARSASLWQGLGSSGCEDE